MSIKIVIFGTGLFYQRRKNMIPKNTEVVGFVDNNKELWGSYLDDILVYAPEQLPKIGYDYIVLASIVPMEMKKQLLSMNVPPDKIMFWEEYVSSQSHGLIIQYNAEMSMNRGSSVLFIVPIINYAGGFLTMYYAAKALVNRGFCVTIASPSGNNDTITEVVADNINVWICPSLPYIEKTELDWIKNFDCIWCNSLQTMLCVDRISKYKPVIWWLHEHGGQYKNILGQYSAEVQDKMFTHVKILSVSDIAKKNILKYYPDLNVKNFVFGLPDFYEREKHEHSKIVFAVIGNISELKNQLEMINAIELLPEVYREKIECWIIGRDCSKKYRCDFENVVSNLNYVKICGEMTREQIEKIFSDIDVVVCTSIEETMSITIVEGMMNKKICITNSNTGIAAFISDGVNGFVYQNQNPFQLSKKIKYIVDEFSNLDCMRERARETYENNFSFERYCQNILDVMNI